MTDLRKAAECLLEGVEAAIKAGDWKVDGACDPDSAIVRLRQALAQPEQESVICRNIYEIWAGSDGVPIPETIVEAYLLRLIEQMRDEASKGLKPLYTAPVDGVNISAERVDETAKSKHEPVAWFVQYEYRHEFLWRKPNELEQKTALEINPLYTAPPISDYHEGWEEGFKAAKREWVGLTDEEIHEVVSKKWWDWEDAFDIEGFIRAIETKLKEKNT